MLCLVAQNYAEPIGLKEIAGHAGVSQNYAITLFKTMLGITVKEHLTELRIYYAEMLLAETGEKVLNIALDCASELSMRFPVDRTVCHRHAPLLRS